MSDLDAQLRAQLSQTLVETPFRAISGQTLPRYDGKVRDCYIDSERGERVIVVTDRLSAFDAVVGTIPFKGQVLNQLAQFWFEKTSDIAPNHMPHPERVFRTVQMSWHPPEWGEDSPWMRMFYNARAWVG